MELRTLSLFSGIGGFEVAAQKVGGFRVTQFVEINCPILDCGFTILD
jgi:site-specific DNA-cytosine methylase